MEDNNETEQKPTATKWTCSECGQKLTLYVAPSVAPTCTNPEVHPKKTIKMLPVTKR
jgi:rubrerythrin